MRYTTPTSNLAKWFESLYAAQVLTDHKIRNVTNCQVTVQSFYVRVRVTRRT